MATMAPNPLVVRAGLPAPRILKKMGLAADQRQFHGPRAQRPPEAPIRTRYVAMMLVGRGLHAHGGLARGHLASPALMPLLQLLAAARGKVEIQAAGHPRYQRRRRGGSKTRPLAPQVLGHGGLHLFQMRRQL